MTEAVSRIRAIRVQRLYLQVAEQLQALISEGAFRPGERLPSERDLATRFEVSRPTIREAMIALEIAGVVEVRSGSGVYVLAKSAGNAFLGEAQDPGPFEILEARKVVESETCALAAQRISDEQLVALRGLLNEMSDEHSDVALAEQADQQFHCLIAEAAENSALAAMVAWLWQLRNESEISTRFHERVREEGSRPTVSDHLKILYALEKRDSKAASDAMAAHLQRVIDYLLEAM